MALRYSICALLTLAACLLTSSVHASEGDSDPIYIISDMIVLVYDIIKWNEHSTSRELDWTGLCPRVSEEWEPVSAALSTFILAIQFQGWISFCLFLNFKLPLLQNNKHYYEYAGLWHIYGLLAMNFWFWSAGFHSRQVELTEKLEISSGVALLGFSLILAILRAFNVKDEATRVMVSAPLIAFVTTHILFLNFYELDHGLNMKVCLAMEVTRLLIWATWAVVTRHPSHWKVWVVVISGGLAVFFKIYDFPPYMGYLDAHTFSHFFSIASYFWWSFIKDDAEFHRTAHLKKMK
ncbi:hypothetical protein ACFE04_004253 [Oxalis oulophora]